MNSTSLTIFWSLIDPASSQQIAWLIMHFLWQDILVGAGVYASNIFMRNQTSAAKYRVLVAWMLVLLLCVPATWWFGLLKPVLLLPSFAVSGMTSAELDAILLHELAHIRRGDLLVNCLQRVAECLLFFHPVTWYVSRQISVVREQCCDDIVLARYEPQQYARALIRLAEFSTSVSPRTIALAATGTPSELRRRVQRMLGAELPKKSDHAGFVMSVACILLIAGSVVVVRAQSDADSTAAPPTAEDVVETTAASPECSTRSRSPPLNVRPLSIDNLALKRGWASQSLSQSMCAWYDWLRPSPLRIRSTTEKTHP